MEAAMSAPGENSFPMTQKTPTPKMADCKMRRSAREREVKRAVLSVPAWTTAPAVPCLNEHWRYDHQTSQKRPSAPVAPLTPLRTNY